MYMYMRIYNRGEYVAQCVMYDCGLLHLVMFIYVFMILTR